jgi:hypothetical protein
MRRLTSPFGLILFFIVMAVSVPAPSRAQVAGLTLTEAGRNASGRPLYDLKAEKADLVDVLKQLFQRAGIGSYEISQEVRQSVTLSAKGATADELIDKVRGATVPPFNIQTNGRTVFVTRSATAVSRAEEIRRRMESNQFKRMPGLVPGGVVDSVGGVYRDAAALDRPVTLVVPDDKPITLSAALQAFERQTGVPIRLDRSLSPDIKFLGSVTNVPLRSVLQKLAPGNDDGSLKIVTMPNQIVIAPADRFNVMLNGTAIMSTEGCQKCRQPLHALWSFCPNCGQVTRRGQLGIRKSAPRPE